MWAVVFEYGWYSEPYGFFNDQMSAERALFKAKRCRPNHKVKLIRVRA